MRRLVAWIVDGLPFDPRSRRAIDETLLDWAHEQGSATTLGRRAAVEVRALMSVARALAGAVTADLVRAPWRPLAVRVMVVMVALLAALVSTSYTLMWPDLRAALGTPAAVELSLLEALHEAELLIPVLIFMALAWPGPADRRPTVGTAMVVLFGMLLLTLWLEPLGNARYTEVAGPAWRQLHQGSTLSAAGRDLSELFVEHHWFPGAILFGAVAFKIGLAWLAAGLALLAASIRAGRLALGRRWLVLSPLLYLGVFKLAATGYVFDYFLPRTIVGTVSWLLVLALITIGFIRAARSQRWLLLVPGNLALLWFVVLPADRLLLYRAFVSGPLPSLLSLVAVAVAISARRSAATQPHGAHA